MSCLAVVLTASNDPGRRMSKSRPDFPWPRFQRPVSTPAHAGNNCPSAPLSNSPGMQLRPVRAGTEARIPTLDYHKILIAFRLLFTAFQIDLQLGYDVGSLILRVTFNA